VKVLILVEAHAQALQGRFRWTDLHTLTDEEKVGANGSLQREAAGTTWTCRQLARRMILESDNTASNILLERLGMASVNARAGRLGLQVTRFERAFMDVEARRRGRENWTTAREMGRVMRAMFRKEILTPEACEEMIRLLELTAETGIAAGLPRGIAVGRKGGSLPGLRHDVGWVRLSGQPYILSIFLDNVLERPEGEEDRGVAAIEAASAAVFEALGPSDE
jgi:beta-lactamase class A